MGILLYVVVLVLVLVILSLPSLGLNLREEKRKKQAKNDKPAQQEEREIPQPDEKKQNLVKVLGDALADHLEEKRPVTAAFTPFCVQFPVIDTQNEGRLQLTCNAPGEVRLQLGVYRKDTDRMYSNFMPAAAEEEMIRYLRSPEAHREWLEQIAHLSDKVDDYWD